MKLRVAVLLLLLGGTQPLAAEETLEARLLRTIQIGRLQEISLDEIHGAAWDSEKNFSTHVLARSALTVLGKDRGFPDWPVERLLDQILATLLPEGAAYQPLPGLPPGWSSEDMVFTVVYALTVTGQGEKATDVLESHLALKPARDSDFKRAVVLQALRNIGSPRATELIRQAAGPYDDHNIAENLLADLQHPFLEELRQHLPLIPPSARDRRKLLGYAREGCTTRRRGTLAVYFMGFFAENPDREAEEAEWRVLHEAARSPCVIHRIFAHRSVAMRFQEPLEFWLGLYERETDGWARDYLVRIMWIHHTREFLPRSLEFLATEGQQGVQWELMHGNILLREHGRWRDYWDLWHEPTLQFRINTGGGWGQLKEGDLDEILSWLEKGARPRDAWVHNHMLYALARSLRGPYTRRFLRIFNARPEKGQHWWILSPLRDPSALPMLRYWLTLDAEPMQRQELVNLIEELEASRQGRGPLPRTPCCSPTRECLLEEARSATGPEPTEIQNERQAEAWLAGAATGAEPQIEFLDELERIALVHWPDGSRMDRWEHLFGCWRRVQTAVEPR